MALFCQARTDGRCQVAVFTVAAAASAAGKRHRVAIAAGLALVVEITETQRDTARRTEQAAGTGGVFRRHLTLSVSGGSAAKPAPTGVYRVERTGKQPAPADAARAGELNRRGQPLLADLAHQPLAGAGEVD